jgi:hypothetical protein
MAGPVDFHMREVAAAMTLKVRVRGLRIFRVRFWLGVTLIRCAAHIMGVGIEIEVDRASGAAASES